MIRNLVVVGINDTGAALAAMEWAADYARMTDAKLKAVHVRPTGHSHWSSNPMTATADDEAGERIRAIFYSVRPEPDWVLTTTIGASGATLVNAAEHAVVLVIGSRQVTGLDGALHHSVSRYCTLHAKVPVVICPDLDEARAHVDDHQGGFTAWSPPTIADGLPGGWRQFPVNFMIKANSADP